MVTTNKSLENPNLVKTIDDLLNFPSQSTELRMIDEIKKAKYISPVLTTEKADSDIPGTKNKMAFMLLINAIGEKFLPVFTDWNELRKWSKDHEETIISSFSDMSSLTIARFDNIKGFVINPYSQNVIVTEERLQYISNINNIKEVSK